MAKPKAKPAPKSAPKSATKKPKASTPPPEAAAPEPVTGKLQTRQVALNTLHLDPANARIHPEKNMASIVGSLRQFGQVEPLVVQKGTGKIIGGNGRYQAMQALGWTHAQVVEVDFDDLHATALGIALNRTSELAEWDTATLGRLLDELQKDSFDLSGIGFSDEELARMIPADGFGVTNPDGEWTGMPEFDHNDKTSVRQLIVHFKSEEDAQAFAGHVGQKLTDKTKYIWYPEIEIEKCMDKLYVADEEAEEDAAEDEEES